MSDEEEELFQQYLVARKSILTMRQQGKFEHKKMDAYNEALVQLPDDALELALRPLAALARWQWVQRAVVVHPRRQRLVGEDALGGSRDRLNVPELGDRERGGLAAEERRA